MTEPSELILARHGEVAGEWTGRIYGDLDVPLSAEGERQSVRMAAALKGVPLDAVLSSGLSRAEFAARLLRESRPGLDRRDEACFSELHRGDWAGLGEAEIEERSPGAWAEFWARGSVDPPPGGETLEQIRRRVVGGLDRVADELAGGRAVIVAHKWVLRVACCEAIGLAVSESFRLEVPTAALCVLEWPTAAGRAAGERPVLAAFGADRFGG